MDEELNQCLNAIPGFVAQLEMEVHSTDLNLIEWLIMRAKRFLELLSMLSGEFKQYSDKIKIYDKPANQSNPRLNTAQVEIWPLI